ncbi:GspE/PulE family protein [Luedemannella helvata]|uniref:GspE/PulE family protein n=1 Tax=Luedemannella helvata TaxID=349315 RepID=A0ABP4X930_9ACTN
MKLIGRSAPGPAERPAPEPALGPVAPVDLAVEPGGQRLGEILVDANVISRGHVVAALANAQRGTPRYLGQRLVGMGLLTERDLAMAVANRYGVELVDLRETVPQQAALGLLDEATARELTVIPLAVDQQSVVVAVAVPSAALVGVLQRRLGRPVRILVARESDILHAIGINYRALAGVASHVRAFETQSVNRASTAVRAEATAVNDDAPVVQVVHLMITQALRDRASDIHIEPQPERIRVRYRIDGALHDVLDLPAAMGPVIVSRIKIMANMNIVERRRPQDGQISLEIEGRGVDIRVSTTSVIEGEKVVMRLLDKSRTLYRLEQLGMPEDMAARYQALLRSPYGMVMCAGPTGSGKTTTLYGSLAELNTPERNVMTIEDPVEYRVESISQIQINEQAGVTFATGLRSILRQDPDVILVGEIRDVETAHIAVQAALTGHFVLSSIHATDAAAALHRLLDMGVESFLVASSVTAVVSQRLVRRVCPHCRGRYEPTPEEYALLMAIGGRPPAHGFLRGHGCNFCAHTGFLERIGVYEIMPVSEAIRELVLGRAPHDQVRKVARAEGMRTLQEEAALLVEAGVTTLDEVLRSIYVIGS